LRKSVCRSRGNTRFAPTGATRHRGVPGIRRNKRTITNQRKDTLRGRNFPVHVRPCGKTVPMRPKNTGEPDQGLI